MDAIPFSRSIRMASSNVFIVCSSRPLIREAFERLIEGSNLIIVGAGNTFADVVGSIATGQTIDLVVGFFESEEAAGDELLQLRDARTEFGAAKIIIVTRSIQPSILRAAVEMGVEAVLTMEISTLVLQRAIELVLLGQRLLPIEVGQLLDTGPNPADPVRTPLLEQSPSSTAKRAQALSQREHEILRHLVSGYSNKIIARELNITEATVKVHVKALLRKTQMTNRTQAAIWALNNGLQSGTGEAGPELIVPRAADGSWDTETPSNAVPQADTSSAIRLCQGSTHQL